MSRILQYYDKSIFEISDHFIKVIFPFITAKDTAIIANGDNLDESRVIFLIKQMPEITAKGMSAKTATGK